jgi:8-oxo-dGTP pyrophosphatase MutT (NUDIX family)
MVSLLHLLTSDWMDSARRQARREPDGPRLPLWCCGELVGSVSDSLIQSLMQAGYPLGALQMAVEVAPAGSQLSVVGDPEQAWTCWMEVLLRLGWLQGAHSERLPLFATTGQVVGAIPRPLARWLGVTTHSVHVVGFSTSGCCWVQKRSAFKTEDPGRWDTLMGGTVMAGEQPEDALSRELWEEAGLRLTDLSVIQPMGMVKVRQPRSFKGQSGYQIEHIHCFAANLLEGRQPANQDGEVALFECLSPAELSARMLRQDFTIEAASVLVQVLCAPDPVKP